MSREYRLLWQPLHDGAFVIQKLEARDVERVHDHPDTCPSPGVVEPQHGVAALLTDERALDLELAFAEETPAELSDRRVALRRGQLQQGVADRVPLE